MKRTTAAILVAAMFVMAMFGSAFAHDGCLTIGPVPGGIILWCPDAGQPTPTPTIAPEQPTATAIPPTATAVPPTPTAVPPTNTPAPTATAPTSPLPTPQPTATAPVSPLPTPQPTPTTAPPQAQAWKCPESAHDKTAYHSHYNPQLKCWYDHVHGNNPASIAYAFGQPWAFLSNYPGYDASKPEWQLKAISYPWQTGNGMEQAVKHGGYKWVNGDVSPQNGDVLAIPRNDRFDANWNTGVAPGLTWTIVDRLRFEEHFGSAFAHNMNGMDSIMFDGTVRFHSFWVEMQGRDGAIIGGGGHWDTGRLRRYGGMAIPLPVDPNPMSPRQINGMPRAFADPYRGDSFTCEEITGKSPTPSLWTSRPPWIPGEEFDTYDYHHNNHLGVFSVHKDISACSYKDGTHKIICTDGDCGYANNTNFGPFKVWAYISPSWDGSAVDRDSRKGYVTFYTWTDTRGLPAPTCTAPGAECVPYYAVNARPGWYAWASGKGQPYVDAFEFDQSPAGKSYINLLGN